MAKRSDAATVVKGSSAEQKLKDFPETSKDVKERTNNPNPSGGFSSHQDEDILMIYFFLSVLGGPNVVSFHSRPLLLHLCSPDSLAGLRVLLLSLTASIKPSHWSLQPSDGYRGATSSSLLRGADVFSTYFIPGRLGSGSLSFR